MSSWERSRFLPWDRIPLPDTRQRMAGEPMPVDLDTKKERIFRQLQHEAMVPPPAATASNEATTSLTHQADATTNTTTTDTTNNNNNIVIPYSHMDLLRQAAFGGCIGTITGSVFGFMDGMRLAGESPVLQKASNGAKFKYLMQGTTRSATIFGTFFAAFHVLKYGLRCTVHPGEYAEIFWTAPIGLGALYVRPTTRAAVPYASMLVGMDLFNLYMRKTD